jgi:hypothetical protein
MSHLGAYLVTSPKVQHSEPLLPKSVIQLNFQKGSHAVGKESALSLPACLLCAAVVGTWAAWWRPEPRCRFKVGFFKIVFLSNSSRIVGQFLKTLFWTTKWELISICGNKVSLKYVTLILIVGVFD